VWLRERIERQELRPNPGAFDYAAVANRKH
jgi:hypothetical protein